MKCQNCGAEVDRKWKFCPKCGAPVKRRSIFDLFSRDIFSVNRQIKQMEREMSELERSFETLDISPMLRKSAKARGFTIRIERRNREKPEVSVETFGDVDKNRLEKEIREQLGENAPVTLSPVEKKEHRPSGLPKSRPIPGETSEPKTEIRRVDSKVIVDMDVPGVKDEDDIEINELEESVEVRAYAGNRAYFKIITKPPEFSLSSKSLSNEKLHLEFS